MTGPNAYIVVRCSPEHIAELRRAINTVGASYSNLAHIALRDDRLPNWMPRGQYMSWVHEACRMIDETVRYAKEAREAPAKPRFLVCIVCHRALVTYRKSALALMKFAQRKEWRTRGENWVCPRHPIYPTDQLPSPFSAETQKAMTRAKQDQQWFESRDSSRRSARA